MHPVHQLKRKMSSKQCPPSLVCTSSPHPGPWPVQITDTNSSRHTAFPHVFIQGACSPWRLTCLQEECYTVEQTNCKPELSGCKSLNKSTSGAGTDGEKWSGDESIELTSEVTLFWVDGAFLKEIALYFTKTVSTVGLCKSTEAALEYVILKYMHNSTWNTLCS